MTEFDVLSICNALMDLLVEVEEEEFLDLNIEKGIMHLVDSGKQQNLLDRFKHHPLNMELGGSAMNTTRTLAALGSKTIFFGMVGNDYFGDKIVARMRELGINSRIATTDEATGTCAILITPDGERTMNTCLGASSHYHEGVIPHEDIKASKILHFTGYQWSTDHQKEAVKTAMTTAKQNSTLVSFDVADPFMVRQCRDEFIQVINDQADIVFANAEEASELYNTQPEKAARMIADAGAIAVIKLGAKGALIAHKNDRIPIEPVPTQVIDTTAAGDMFAGGFLYGLVNNKSLADCGKIAAILAADVISRVGAKLSDDALARVNSI